MTFVGKHEIKINRAKSLSTWGEFETTFSAMLDAIPAPVVESLSSASIAELVDSMVGLTQRTKAIAEREAIQNGFIWDAAQSRAREIA